MLQRTAFFIGCLIGGFVIINHFFTLPSLPAFERGNTEKTFEEGSALFVGDVMLGRKVEILAQMSREYGSSYPFVGASKLLTAPHVTVGNLEGAVPEVHVPTKPLTVTFSFDEQFVQAARSHGFDVFSLANNHALDFSESGYIHTRKVCAQNGLLCAGHPTEISTTSIVVVPVGETDLGIIFLQAVFDEPIETDVAALMKELQERSDVQVAYVHWGTEYILTHNKAQEKLAHFLVESGAEAVIGHHPHVIQDVEIYKGKPIFYSLGNFIFDQYFSEDVQRGLGVQIHVRKSDLTYEALFFSSSSTQSQPHPMPEDERTEFVTGWGSGALFKETENGEYTMTVPR